jgi:hypothetical protein
MSSALQLKALVVLKGGRFILHILKGKEERGRYQQVMND